MSDFDSEQHLLNVVRKNTKKPGVTYYYFYIEKGVHMMIQMRRPARPLGISILMIWQTLVTIYGSLRLITLLNVISIAGTEFGISNPEYLRIFFLCTIFINIICMVGIYKHLNWGRNFYIVSLVSILVFKILQSVCVIYRNNFDYFITIYLNMNEVFILFINLVIVLYLLISKKVANYFQFS